MPKIIKKKPKTDEYYRKKCVIIVKQIVRKLANYTCQYCGKKEPNVKTHGSHIYSEGIYKGMSAEIKNILCLCFTHHLGSWNTREPSWHKNPYEMIEWFKNKFPELAEELRLMSQHPLKQNWPEKLKELKEKYQELLKT